jgi:hypothetical protein
MRSKFWVAGLAVPLVIGGVLIGKTHGVEAQGPACSERTLRGSYGIQMQGTRPIPPPLGGGFETVIGVVTRTFDGAGNFTQVDNIKGSVTGFAGDRPGFGTYQVNADCSGVTFFEPGPGVLLEEKIVIVDHGREFRSIVSSPLGVMVSAVGQRIGPR